MRFAPLPLAALVFILNTAVPDPSAGTTIAKPDGASCRPGHALVRHQRGGTASGEVRRIFVSMKRGNSSDDVGTRITWTWRVRSGVVICKPVTLRRDDRHLYRPVKRFLKSGRTSGRYTAVFAPGEVPLLTVRARLVP